MAHDEETQSEMERVRARVHHLADRVQGHTIFIEEHRVRIDRSEKDIAALRLETLAHLATFRAEHATKTELSAATNLAAEKMNTLQKSIDQANKTLERVAWIVMTAVIIALLSLVIVKRDAVASAVSSVKLIPDVAAFAPRIVR